MKHLLFSIAVIFSIWFMISCKPCDKSKLPEIDNLLSELEQMQQKIEGVQIDSMSKICAKLRKEIDIISAVCPPPMMSEAAYDFDLLHITNKGFTRLNNNRGKLLREIETSKKQLAILKQDIKNCIWSTDSIDYFFQGEAQIFHQIACKTEDFLLFVQKDLSISDTLCPKLQHYLDSVAAIIILKKI